MRRFLLGSFITLAIVVSVPIIGYADDLSTRLGIGIGYPYVALKYGFSSKTSGEIRVAFSERIMVYGVRGYHNFNPRDKSVLFIGFELDSVTFEEEHISGDGNVSMLFTGFEHFVSKSLSFCMDIGPAYIILHSGDMDVEGIEWVYNLGINFYF